MFERPGDIHEEFQTIWALYDRLIPAFQQRRPASSPELRESARRYLQYFERHAERPLQAYYEHFGGEFLRYVRSAAEPLN